MNALQTLRNRMALLVSRAIITRTNDGGAFQKHQVNALADEDLDGQEHFGLYGLYSRPKAGAEAIMLSVGAVRSHAVIIATHDRRYRVTGLAEGDVAIADDQGQVIKLGRDGITIVTSKPVSIEAASLAITGDTTITGKLTVSDQATLQGGLVAAGAVKLGDAPVKFVLLADMTPSTQVQAK